MSLKKQSVQGVIWTFAQQFGDKIISFVVSIILARILMPDEFGLIGMISIFVGVGNALMNSGLTQSLIRSDNLNEKDYSTVFFFNLGASFLIYISVFLIAPIIADFYDRPILKGLIRLYCLGFIISAFASVQKTRMTKLMNFKTQTLISLPSTFTGGATGIILAYSGFGVWSLVWYELVSSTVRSVQFWIYAKWKPSIVFDKYKFLYHFSFGYKITLSALIGKISENSIMIVMGKLFAANQVGFYTRANTMKNLPAANLSAALVKVTYPLFSAVKNDKDRLSQIFKKLIQVVLLVIAPVMFFSAVLAEPIFRFLFTEKWLPSVPYFQILCLSGIFYPINLYNSNLLNVSGRSDLFLRITLLKNITLIVLLIILGLSYGVYGMLVAIVVNSILSFLIISYFSSKFIDYKVWNQISDLFPILLISLFTSGILFIVDNKIQMIADIYRILIGFFVGFLGYLMLNLFFKTRGLQEFLKLIKDLKR